MKKLSVLAIALAATCMFSGCGKETKQNVQPAEETYKNTESETSEECAAAQEEFSEEVVDTEESIDDEWTDEASELDEEVASVLANVDTDYNSVYWGTSYSIFEDLPGVVVSITPCMQKDQYGLLVAITNLYSDDIWFNGSAVALDEDGNQIGETYIYEPNLGSGNTAVEVIDCGQTMPDGRVQWTEGQTMEASGTYVPWETDYSVSGNPEDGYLSVDYSFYASDGTPCTGSTLTVCLLDEDGLVIGVGTEFIEKIGENEKEVILDLKEFNKLEKVIKSRIILYTINKTNGNVQGIGKIHIEDIIKLCENNIGNKYLTPNKNIKIFVKKGKIFFMGKMNLP